LAFLGLGIPDVRGGLAFAFFFIGYTLAVGGLLASTFHLGNPQRALKAFSQWRSSWLSREGVVAVAALVVMGIYAAALIFLGAKLTVVGIIGAVLCLGAVFCTSMIYAQLKTVPRWNQPATPALFLLYSVTGGAVLVNQIKLATILMVALTLVQILHWLAGDRRLAATGATIETATGLGFLGRVRLLESPHSGTNYLLKEMAHSVARKHAHKLRVIATLCIGVIPLVFMLAFSVGHALALVIVGCHLIGLFTARWLFFAEAEHVVGLYYDKHRRG
jgi:DMSO reductase anchor subunit